jgi:hypothetical protein
MNDNTNSTEDIDICSICHEDLTGDLYILPECSHKYHTNCIMHWFRAGHNTCPLCNNNGVNAAHVIDEIGWQLRPAIMDKYKKLRAKSRRKDAPEKLKREIKQLKKIEERMKNIKKDYREFRNTVHENKKYSELKNIERRFRDKKWRLQRSIRAKKLSIGVGDMLTQRIIVATKMEV